MDLNRWQLRDNLLAMTITGGTAIGDLLLGNRAVAQALAELDAPSDAVAADDRAIRYPQWAEAALAGEEIGSSPGGEQPKFTATVSTSAGRYAALVKFAMAGDDPAMRRRADLLVCEHLALQGLRAAGIPAAEAELIEGGGHRFLEVRRFDRAPDILGRHEFVSLLALNATFVGDDGRDWSRAGDRLAAQRWIDRASAAQVAALHWFGRLIGNSDMHPGNLGFRLVDEGPLTLTPAYDMLPMSLAPSRAGVLRPAAPIGPGVPERTGQREHIARAATVATSFWEQVAEERRIGSDELRTLAARNRDAVVAFARRFAG